MKDLSEEYKFLLSVDDVILTCEENLQDHLDEGYRIIGI